MKKVLIVDDQKDFQEIIGTKLSAEGYSVDVARTPKEAVEKVESLMPDLVLMDVDLADEELRGPDVALAIHTNEKTKDIKIAFLSNMTDPWPAASGDRGGVSREMGMEDFLDKGANLEETVLKIKTILGDTPTEVAHQNGQA